jgi:malate dehydrogenase (oxaloacetate-decarboxylating)
MGHDPIVIVLANPNPEITPEDAKPLVKVMATGRSEYPNQINNVLCFPGFFRGLIDVRANHVTQDMKIAAAKAIADIISDDELHPVYIIPSLFDRRVSKAVAHTVSTVARESGMARRRQKWSTQGK